MFIIDMFAANQTLEISSWILVRKHRVDDWTPLAPSAPDSAHSIGKALVKINKFY